MRRALEGVRHRFGSTALMGLRLSPGERGGILFILRLIMGSFFHMYPYKNFKLSTYFYNIITAWSQNINIYIKYFFYYNNKIE